MNFWMITIGEFDSGRDKECDKDLDTLIWELGDYENEEPPQEAEEYTEETPIEDELVEKTMIVGRNGRASFKEVPEAEESFFTGEQLATASSIGPKPRRKRTKPCAAAVPAKRKNDRASCSRRSRQTAGKFLHRSANRHQGRTGLRTVRDGAVCASLLPRSDVAADPSSIGKSILSNPAFKMPA